MREVNVGEKLDQYELTELIARSGMASIFKGRDLANGATVAIKVPYLQFESDVVFYGRFQREEEIGRRLDHANIIRVLTPARKSRMYIAMEYIDGISLRAMMRDKRPLDTAKALDIARQICAALVYMHSQGVVHRDLKPENILVTEDGQVKIMDFGIALDESARRLTWSGLSSTIGTPDYMAPEQVSGRRGDVRTDIYALGTMLYEMTTGYLPFEGDNVYAIMRAKANEDPQPPSRYRPDLDPHLEEIILHAIARQPRDRYSTAAELATDLSDPAQVTVTGRASRLHPRSLTALRIKRMLWGSFFFVSLAVLFAFLIWLANRYPAGHPAPRHPNQREVR
ncbi:MAG TPA: serine/threonine-protein kinase [Candidatus Binataceae bacterium]|nr:serine/threonine-protein kinase [Candidatus Binataceae bacterium]